MMSPMVQEAQMDALPRIILLVGKKMLGSYIL
jgi:hypothetical protein